MRTRSQVEAADGPEARDAFVAARRAEYEEDVDIERLAADLVLDSIIEADELRADLVRRLAMLPGVTVTSANDAAQSRRSEPRLAERLERVDHEAEARQPWWRRFGFWFPVAVYAISRVYVLVAGILLAKGQIALPIGLERIRISYPLPADPATSPR